MKAAATGCEVAPSGSGVPLRLAPQVKRQRSETGREYLMHSVSGRVVQVGGTSAMLLDRLERGIELADLISEIESTYPGAGPKVVAFVQQLERAGMLDNSPSQPPARHLVISMPNPDGAARVVAAGLSLLGPVLRYALLTISVAAAVLLAVSAAAGGSLQAMKGIINPHAAFVILLLPVFSLIHEFAHAVAARYVGVPIVAAGILLRRWRTTASFVRTDDSIVTLPRGKRIQVCLAGPLADIVTLGAISAALLLTPVGSNWALVLSFAFVLKTASLTSNLSPLHKSDMSDALSAWFDDYGIRRMALTADAGRLFAPEKIRRYRMATVGHIVLALAIWTGLILSIFRVQQ